METAKITLACRLALGGIVLMAIALRIYLYGMGAAYIPVSTDEALTVLQALDIRNGHLPLLLSAQPYMFPIEAYWMAPLVNLLPRTALGMRTLVMIEGLVFVALSLLILRRMGAWRNVWPGALLIFFPSVYLIMNMTAYSQPHNNSAFILALTATWFILRLNESQDRYDFLRAILGGFFAALAFSNAMLSLALVAPLAIMALWHSIGRDRWVRLVGYATGASLGLIPYFLAMWKMPGAHQSVTATHTWTTALGRLWTPTLTHTLPVTFGWKPCLFPDSKEKLDWGLWGFSAFPFVFSGLMLLAIVLSIFVLISKRRRSEWPSLGGLEFAIGVSVICCLLFTLSKRADASAYRYLAPLLVVFPFLVTGILIQLKGQMRSAFCLFLVGLAAYNLSASIRLPLAWRSPGFADHVLSMPDLEPALTYLREQGIGHGIASHWAAYRINFEADGDIICAQPFNERFPGWPIPYQESIRVATNVAFILTDKIRFLKPEVFRRHLASMGVQSTVFTAGYFIVFHDFKFPLDEQSVRLTPNDVEIVSHENADRIHNLMDSNTQTYWRSKEKQHTNMWLELQYREPRDINRMVLHYGTYKHDQAPAIDIYALSEDGQWSVVEENVEADLDDFAWRNGAPRYGKAQQTYRLDITNAIAVKVQIAEANNHWHWTLADIHLYTPTLADSSVTTRDN